MENEAYERTMSNYRIKRALFRSAAFIFLGVSAIYTAFVSWREGIVLIMGSFLWLATQENLFASTSKLSTQVASAITDIDGKITTRFEAIQMVENPSIKRLADFMEASLEELPLTVSQSVRSQLLEMKGEQTKQLQTGLLESGIAEAVGAQAQEYIAQLSPQAQAAMEIGQMKLSNKFLKEQPIVAMFAKMVQAQAAQFLAGQAQGGQSIGKVVQSEGFRPGI